MPMMVALVWISCERVWPLAELTTESSTPGAANAAPLNKSTPAPTAERMVLDSLVELFMSTPPF